MADPTSLLLPTIDPAFVEEFERQYPDYIILGGSPLAVTYTAEGPKVEIDFWGKNPAILMNLPDGEYALPSGKVVSWTVKMDWYSQVANLRLGKEVRDWVRSRLNGSAWNAWQRPEIPIPNVATSGLPDIIREEYGTDQVTGEPLVAFGAIGWTEDRSFYGSWCDSLAGAEVVRETALRRLQRVRPGVQNHSLSKEDIVVGGVALNNLFGGRATIVRQNKKR